MNKSVIGMSVILLLLVGVFVTTNALQNKQNTKSQADVANSPDITIILPQPNQSFNKSISIESTAKTTVTQNSLEATANLDGKTPQPLRVQTLDQQLVGINGELNAKLYQPGVHTLNIALFDTSILPKKLLSKGSIKVIVTK